MKRLLLACCLLWAPLGVSAETPEEKGLAIAQEVDRRASGFGDMSVDMVMTLKNTQGEESVRLMRLKVLEVTGDGDKSMSIFDEPPDVKGTAMLTYSHATQPDDQWMFLPALKRVKRIASRSKSGPFMGSEFAFEDIASQEVEKFTYRFVKEEEMEGMPCFVVERLPTYEFSGYTRQVTWIDRQEYRMIRIDYYDRKESLLKTQNFRGYQKFLERLWRATQIAMQNHQTGKSTLLQWSNFKFGSGLTDRDFDQESLQRAR